MSLLSWLFGKTDAAPQRLRSVGDGAYDYDIVGESFYQMHLALVCGGKTEDGHEHYTTATLIPQDDNPHDENAVAIMLESAVVGHLARREAVAYRRMLAQVGAANAHAECDAVIVGGWSRRGGADTGYFGVKLDVAFPIRLVDF